MLAILLQQNVKTDKCKKKTQPSNLQDLKPADYSMWGILHKCIKMRC